MKNLLFTLSLICLFTVVYAQSTTQRIVLVEEFTQASCPPCASQNPAFNTFLGNNASKVAMIKYQTDWPGDDPMNANNPTDVATRVSYYGVTGVPDAYMDGVGQGSPAGLTQAELNTQYNNPSKFDIQIAHQYSTTFDSLNITMTIRALDAVTITGQFKGHLVLTEDTIDYNGIPPGTNGETEFYGVMRKMFPNANGTTLPNTWTTGQIETLTFNVPVPTYIRSHYQLSLVGFLQAQTSKVVYQAARKQIDPIAPNDAGIALASELPSGLNCGSELPFTPSVTVENFGVEPITAMMLRNYVNGVSAGSILWEGNLLPGTSEVIELPEVVLTSSSAYYASVVSVNGEEDFIFSNNQIPSTNITLIASTSQAAPIEQNYLSSVFPPAGWAIHNPDGDLTWERVTQGSGGNNGSAKIAFYNILAGGIDLMLMPTVDLSAASAATLTFDVAYTYYSSGGTVFTDDLYVYATTDCSDWVQIYHKAGQTLATAPATGNQFTPTSTQWRTETVNLSQFLGDNVLVRFEGVSGYGNNLYIDNVNLTAVSCTPPVVTTSFTSAHVGAADGTATATVEGVGTFTYLWSNGANTASISGLAPGEYCVVVTNNDCSTESCVTVDEVVGVAMVNGNSVTLAQAQPNPANQVAFVGLSGIVANMSLRVTDLAGKTFQHISLSAGANRAEINTMDLPTGAYLYQLMYQDRVVLTNKMVVVH